MKRKIGNKTSFDPSSLDDPIALKTAWTPAKPGGTSFRTHDLIIINSDRAEFRATKKAMLVYLIFLLVGMYILIDFSFSNRLSFDITTFVVLLFGFVFTGLGSSLFYYRTTPVIFNKKTGLFWKGRMAPRKNSTKSLQSPPVALEHIHSLQLISEDTGYHPEGSFHSYELNLVLKNGQRINVVDHGSKNRLQKDAAILSDFLGKPVWDAT